MEVIRRNCPLQGTVTRKTVSEGVFEATGIVQGSVGLDFAPGSGYNDHMQSQIRKTVGSRELKTRFGTYLRQVQAGTTLVVTDRGRPVAELRALQGGQGDLDTRLSELIALGIVSGEVTGRPELESFEPIRSRGAALSEAIIEDREDRF